MVHRSECKARAAVMSTHPRKKAKRPSQPQQSKSQPSAFRAFVHVNPGATSRDITHGALRELSAIHTYRSTFDMLGALPASGEKTMSPGYRELSGAPCSAW
jgi:hypothetical protein